MEELMSLKVGVDYEWKGTVLVGISEEGINKIIKLMETNTWPFIKELCSWDNESTMDIPKVKFERNDEVLVFTSAQTVLGRE